MTITQQEIIALAVEAGFDDITPWLDAENVEQGQIDAANRWIERMTAFAALSYQRGVRDEREACAKVCDDHAELYADEGGDARSCANAIRARSEK